jgi:hypothetical protein
MTRSQRKLAVTPWWHHITCFLRAAAPCCLWPARVLGFQPPNSHLAFAWIQLYLHSVTAFSAPTKYLQSAMTVLASSLKPAVREKTNEQAWQSSTHDASGPVPCRQEHSADSAWRARPKRKSATARCAGRFCEKFQAERDK